MKYETERSECVPCVRDDCEFWDNALDACCSAAIDGEPAIVCCPKYEPEDISVGGWTQKESEGEG